MTSTSALPGTTILNLPAATTLDGSEWFPMVQGGTTKRVEGAKVSNFLYENGDFIMGSTSLLAFFPEATKLTPESGVTTVTLSSIAQTATVGVATNGIGNTKIRQGAAFSVIGRSTNSTGDVADIAGTTDQVLRVSSAGTALEFGAVNLASSLAVNNQLTVPNGGTGVASFTPYAVVIGGTTSSSPLQNVSAGSSAGQVLTWVSSIASPTWQTLSGTAAAGLQGQIAFYSSDGTALAGSPYATVSSGAVTIGLASSNTGRLLLASSAGGTTTLTPSSATVTLTGPVTTTTLIGNDTVNTLTGKTFNTAGSSNLLQINGNTVNAVTGTGSVVVLSSGPSLAAPSISSGILTGGQISAISSFGLRTTGAAFDLVIGSTEALTASRNLNIRVGNATRNLVLNGDLTIVSSFPVAFTSTAASSLAIPVTGTLATLAGAETLTNKTINTVSNTFQISSNTISTASSILDMLGSSQGMVLYRSSVAWTTLTIGTSAQVLTGGSNPQWATPAGTGTVTSSGGSTDTALARWNGTTGTVLQDSVVTLSSIGALSRTGGVSIQGPNSSAATTTGFVGEILSVTASSSSFVSFTASNTPITVTSLTISPGHWLVSAGVIFDVSQTATVTTVTGGLSTTAAVIPTAPSGGAYATRPDNANAANSAVLLAPVFLQLGSSTTYNLVANSIYTAGSSHQRAFGYISAMRML